MRKLTKASLPLLIICLVLSMMSCGNKEKKAVRTGWITDSSCGAQGANSGHAACAKRCVGRGEKYSLYTPEAGKLYVLEPQEKAADYAAKEVKVGFGPRLERVLPTSAASMPRWRQFRQQLHQAQARLQGPILLFVVGVVSGEGSGAQPEARGN